MINYTLITKPGIILGNLLTALAGFLLGTEGNFQPTLFLAMMGGLGTIIASGCIFNNFIDRNLDQLMERTKNRPLASGKISPFVALSIAFFLLVTGSFILFFYTNSIALALALAGFSIYVFPYSHLKSKSLYATAIGSLAGAMPPVIGYVAAKNSLDLGALLLFLLLIFWQMPHFYAIALMHAKDYKKAGLPMLPFVKGIFRTKIHMVLYIALFIFSLSLLSLFHYTNTLFFSLLTFFALLWLALSFSGFKATSNALWGKQMFQLSLVIITLFSLLMPIGR